MKTHRARYLLSGAAALSLAACAAAPHEGPAPAAGPAPVGTATVVAAKTLKWDPLNPARGDRSPQATNLWGDRRAPGATGFLVRFVDGFSSPPHIHNVSYRGVVISGEAHNDDPAAAPMWMPAGSYWTQPKGEPHITSARGSTMAYIEIDDGPYLVRPPGSAFETAQRPVNLHRRNLVWTPADQGAQVALLWGDPTGDGEGGALLSLPAGGRFAVQGGLVRAVLVQGRLRAPDRDEALGPGSYLGQDTGALRLECTPGADCQIYVRVQGALRMTEAR